MKSIIIKVDGRPVPWSAPTIGVSIVAGKRRRYCKINKRLTLWQAKIANAEWKPTEDAMTHQDLPFRGTIKLAIEVHLETKNEKLWGLQCVPSVSLNDQGKFVKTGKGSRDIADLTNLVKAIEDALQPQFIANDCMVYSIVARRRWGKTSGVNIYVEERYPPVDASDRQKAPAGRGRSSKRPRKDSCDRPVPSGDGGEKPEKVER